MAWLRLDDGFTKHPKFEGWPPAQRWAWLEVMEYCARYSTRGRIPTDVTLLPRSVTAPLLTKAEAARWCSREEDGALWINDWDEFNPPRQTDEELEELVVSTLERHPQASANEIVKLVGGQRKVVLSIVKRLRETAEASGTGGSQVVPAVVPGTSSESGSGGGSGNQAGTGSRAGARPRTRPVPSPREPSSAVDVAENGSPAAAEQHPDRQEEPPALPHLEHVLNDIDWS